MNKLTLQDYIELEQLIKENAGEFEQQSFLLSRYYDLSLDHIKKIDIRLINLMLIDMNKYVEKTQMSKEEIDSELKKLTKKIKKDREEGKYDSTENRFGILDL